MKSYRRVLAAAALTLVTGILATGCGDDDEKAGPSESPTTKEPTKVSLLLDWTVGAEHTGYIVADKLGYYEEAGLEIEIVEGQGSATTVKVVGSGNNEFGVVSAGEVMLGVTNGVPVKAIATIVQSSPTAVVYNTDKLTVNDLTDLYGHKFGVVTQSSAYKEWQSVASVAGIDVSKIEEVDVGQSLVPAILNGDVDAMMGWTFNQAIQARLQGCACEWKLFTEFGQPDIPNSTVVVNNDFAEKSPEAVQAFVDATMKGWRYAADNPEEALKLVYEEYSEIDKAYNDEKLPAVLELMGGKDDFGKFDAEKWEALKKFYIAQGTIADDVALTDVYDDSYTS